MSRTRSLVIPYAAVTIIWVFSVLAFFFAPSDPNWDWSRALTANVTTDIGVVLLLTFLIDRVIQRNQESERERYKTVAMRQLRAPLVHHLGLLFNMYKAALAERPKRTIKQVADLFSDDYAATLSMLDFGKTAPVYPHIQWSLHLERETQVFKNALTSTIDKYAMHLDPDTLDLLEELINSAFMGLCAFAHFTITHNQKLYDNSGYYQFFSEGMQGMVQDYTALFSKLVDKYNEYCTPELRIVFSENSWSDNTSPKIGQDRMPDTMSNSTTQTGD